MHVRPCRITEELFFMETFWNCPHASNVYKPRQMMFVYYL